MPETERSWRVELNVSQHNLLWSYIPSPGRPQDSEIWIDRLGQNKHALTPSSLSCRGVECSSTSPNTAVRERQRAEPQD
jgi:hypothetical protein